jgi:hypothetical protein
MIYPCKLKECDTLFPKIMYAHSYLITGRSNGFPQGSTKVSLQGIKLKGGLKINEI